MSILVTGAAGFIGFHLSRRLLTEGHHVIGIDNLNAYYEVALKEARLSRLKSLAGFEFHQLDIADQSGVRDLFERHRPSTVVNLAAQAGVRYSIENPGAYIESNLVGFGNILEGCRRNGVQHLQYASSSSVYGSNTRVPFSTDDSVDHPLSLYAATKKANELMAHTYSHLYDLPTTGLRFFTVYGPWGRPDMALFSFTRAILEGRPIDVYNGGAMSRDFTYVDDVVEAISRLLHCRPRPAPKGTPLTPATSYAPYAVYNIGNSQPASLLQFIQVLERCLDRTASMNLMPMQPGDVPATWADVEALARATGFRPDTPLEIGVRRFVDWYLWYSGAHPDESAARGDDW